MCYPKKFHTKTSQQWINLQPAHWVEQHRVWLWVWRSFVVSSLPILCPTRLVSFSSIHLWFVLHESVHCNNDAQCALKVFLIFFFLYLSLLSPLILVSRKDVSSMNWLRPRSRAARRRGRGRRKRKIWTNWRRKWIWWEFGLVRHPIPSQPYSLSSLPSLPPPPPPPLLSFVAIHPFPSTVNLHLFILWEVSFQNKRSADNAPANVIGHTHRWKRAHGADADATVSSLCPFRMITSWPWMSSIANMEQTSATWVWLYVVCVCACAALKMGF